MKGIAALKIVDPCSESWEEMTPVGKLCRHCDTCQKQVHDLAKLTKRQASFLYLKHAGRVCFRVTIRDNEIQFREEAKIRLLDRLLLTFAALGLFLKTQMAHASPDLAPSIAQTENTSEVSAISETPLPQVFAPTMPMAPGPSPSEETVLYGDARISYPFDRFLSYIEGTMGALALCVSAGAALVLTPVGILKRRKSIWLFGVLCFLAAIAVFFLRAFAASFFSVDTTIVD